MNNQILNKYFPELSREQKDHLFHLEALVREWNEKINVISRKDIDHVFIHHILHSLALFKFVRLKPGITVLDAGTGGGFPGMPLAIVFPDVQFKLIDGRNKKTLVAGDIAKKLNLKNVVVQNIRSEELKERFDVILGRAVAELPEFVRIVKKNLKKPRYPQSGIYYWTGGNVSGKPDRIYRIEKIYDEDYFKGKYIVHIRSAWSTYSLECLELF